MNTWYYYYYCVCSPVCVCVAYLWEEVTGRKKADLPNRGQCWEKLIPHCDWPWQQKPLPTLWYGGGRLMSSFNMTPLLFWYLLALSQCLMWRLLCVFNLWPLLAVPIWLICDPVFYSWGSGLTELMLFPVAFPSAFCVPSRSLTLTDPPFWRGGIVCGWRLVVCHFGRPRATFSLVCPV